MDLEQYVKVVPKTMYNESKKFTYKLGLNEDKSGGKGLHFCKLKHVSAWLMYGDCIVNVSVPEGTKIKQCDSRQVLSANKIILSELVLKFDHPCWSDDAFGLIITASQYSSRHVRHMKHITDEMITALFNSSKEKFFERFRATRKAQTPELCCKVLEAAAQVTFHPSIYVDAANAGEPVVDYVLRVGKKRKVEELGLVEEPIKKKST